LFDNPTHDERILYVQYWQKKLKHNKEISFPDTLRDEIANLTFDFSFAYLKEALYVPARTPQCADLTPA
jgi:transitional endoplasmic reticulum ATPase